MENTWVIWVDVRRIFRDLEREFKRKKEEERELEEGMGTWMLARKTTLAKGKTTLA